MWYNARVMRLQLPQLNRVIGLSIAATMLLGMSIGVEAYARPADTLSGAPYYVESAYVSQEALDNDWRVMNSIPAISGGKVGTIGTTGISGQTIASLQDCINAYAQKRRDVSFVMMDLKSGRTVYYNTAFNVYSASCIKGPYIISCLMAGNDATNDMYLAGHYSDNDAYHRIRNKYGNQVYASWLRKAGVDTGLATYYYCHLTSLDLTRMWLQTYPYITGDATGASSARQILQDSKFSAIEMQLGNTYTVYSKAGWISDGVVADYNSYNVGGIVMGSNPYLLIITSNARGTTTEAQNLVTVLEAAHNEIVAQLDAELAARQAIEAAQAEAAAAQAAQEAQEAAQATPSGLPGITFPAADTTTTDLLRSALPDQTAAGTAPATTQ